MKPIPAQKIIIAQPVAGDVIPSLPSALPSSSATYSKANRRTPVCAALRIYPWLLAISTATAAVFCLLYITKPVIIPAPAMIAPLAAPQTPPRSEAAPVTASEAPDAPLLPGSGQLPGEQAPAKPIPSDPRSALSGAASSPFEETNLRVQHVLTAEAPGGHLDRIVLDVPVLYQSRQLRWTTQQVAEARELLVRLMNHQEKTHVLRAEGIELLDAWNDLVESSLPLAELRADSPSLPANQQDAADAPRSTGLLTTEAVELQPALK